MWYIVTTTCRLSPSQAKLQDISFRKNELIRLWPLRARSSTVNGCLKKGQRSAEICFFRALPTNAILQRHDQASRKVFCNSQFCGTVTPARCLLWDVARVHVMSWRLHMLQLQSAVTNSKQITPGNVIGPVIECFSHIRINYKIS